MPAWTSLSQVVGLLTDEEIRDEITNHYSRCSPSEKLLPLTNFLWRRIFTFNVDDVIQKLYNDAIASKQSLTTVNYNGQFQPDAGITEVLIVHLHGHVQSPADRYVFSRNEYARVMREQSPWMMLLGQTIATEPFVIAGTSLDEIDLEYYLSKRTNHTPRRERGPSLLVEPSPTALTAQACEKYGLTLVKGTFQQFLEWLHRQVPSPPSAAELVVPDESTLFAGVEDKTSLIKFYSDFKAVTPSREDLPVVPSGFFYGQKPTDEDFWRHADIQRDDNDAVHADVLSRIEESSGTEAQVMLLLGEPGSGKSTIVGRIAHDFARAGIPVFASKMSARLDVHSAAECLGSLSTKTLVVVDGIADHIEQVVDLILREPAVRKNVVFLGSDRLYRKEHIDRVLAGVPALIRDVSETSDDERLALLSRYRDLGIVGLSEALRAPEQFVSTIKGDPIAVAVCRILDNFRPLDRIVESVWNACPDKLRVPYLAVAIAHHCYGGGIKYSVLQQVAGTGCPISDLFVKGATSLNIVDSQDAPEYVIPAVSIIAERVVLWARAHAPGLMLKSFESISDALAPSVNRLAITRRTPESRLASRLFNADDIAVPLLREKAASWYEGCQQTWGWNSRYWEQRALLALESNNLDVAISHAKHALAIERGPYALTTISKVLHHRMKAVPDQASVIFSEIINYIEDALRMERDKARVTIHPFMVFLQSAKTAKSLNVQLDNKYKMKYEKLVAKAASQWGYDQSISVLVSALK